MIKQLSSESVSKYRMEIIQLLRYCKECSTGECLSEQFYNQKVDELISYLKENKAYFFALFFDDKMVGFLWACVLNRESKSVFHILYFAVSSKEQGKGFGKKLLNAAEKKAKELNLDEIELNVHHSNKSAKEFYLRQQYLETDINLMFERIRMIKNL